MKYMVLCSALLLSISLAAQQATGSSSASPDKPRSLISNGKVATFSGSFHAAPVVIHNSNDDQNAQDGFHWWRRLKDGGSPETRTWLADNFQPMCATMRTYRVKREDRDSDVTREAGYSECISISKFRIENAAPELGSADSIITPSE